MIDCEKRTVNSGVRYRSRLPQDRNCVEHLDEEHELEIEAAAKIAAKLHRRKT